MKQKVIALFMAGVLAAGVLTGCGGSENTDNNTTAAEENTEVTTEEEGLVVVRDAVMTGQLDQYATEIGKWQGIFEKYGIDLQTSEFVAGINTIDAVVNGTADIGMMADYAAVNRLGNTLDSTDLRIFSQLSGGATAGTGGLYVAPEYVDNLEALDGSEGFMYQEGTVSYYYTGKALEYLGLDEEKQNLINTDSSQTRLALISKGEASAAYASGPEAKYYEEAGWQLVATSEELGILTGAYFLAPEGYIKENTEVLSNFLLAVDESTEYIDAHVDECAEYLEEKLGVKADDFKLSWANYSFSKGFSEEAAVHLEDIEDWAFAHGSFPKEYNIRDFIDTSVVEKAFPDDVTIEK